MNKPEIDSIVARILSGDIDAYEAIVSSYQQEVWKVVAAMLLNAQRTEDLVEQTFIKAFQHLHHYERERDFGAWIKEIARNKARLPFIKITLDGFASRCTNPFECRCDRASLNA